MSVRPVSEADLQDILAQTRPLWEEMRNAQVFITGGTGFFGCWLLESFSYINRALDLNAGATVLTRDARAFAGKVPHLAHEDCITLHEGDVRDFKFPQGEFPFIIHAATEASAKQAAEEPLEMLTTILDGTERVLKFAAEAGTRKMLLTSSGAVYGRQPTEITHLPETYSGAPNPLEPASVYGEGKRASELMCALYQKSAGFECKIARCWAFCGPHLPLRAHFAIGNFIDDAMHGRTIQISGDGSPRRSYLYSSDLMIWLWTILFRATPLVPINVGSAEDLSIAELAETVSETLHAKVLIQRAHTPVANRDVSRYVPCVDRAEALLGLKQTVSLQDAIRKTAKWYGWTGKVDAA
jgi:dTDP-glucose 4,6-dehydratase